jgi:internalin A
MKRNLSLTILSVFLCSGLPVRAVAVENKKSFVEWCQQQETVPINTRRTIDALLAKANTQDCEQANSKLQNLTVLQLQKSQIVDLQPLAGFVNLTELNLSDNQIEDLRPLSGLANLLDLNVAANQISNLKPLAGLSHLTELTLSVNRISNVQPLAELSNLTLLMLSDNPIHNVAPLAKLKKLSLLAIGSDVDVRPLKASIAGRLIIFRL